MKEEIKNIQYSIIVETPAKITSEVTISADGKIQIHRINDIFQSKMTINQSLAMIEFLKRCNELTKDLVAKNVNKSNEEGN